MPRMTGGDAIVDSLLQHGIDTVFGLPGVQMYGLFDAFARNSNRMKVINARHEQTTAYMAMGYAQSTGKPSAFTVDVRPWISRKLAALQCHHTQMGPQNPLAWLDDEDARQWLGVEHFYRLDGPAAGPLEALGEPFKPARPRAAS